MELIYRREGANWNQNLLCVSHTDRALHQERANLNFLELRYTNPNRLPPKEPFESLTPSIEHSPYLGAVSIWEFDGGSVQKPRLLAHFRPDRYKPQHVIWHKQRLWVLGIECLEVYDASFKLIKQVHDPWLAGAHTIAPDGKGRMILSCSGSDSVLLLDETSYKIVKALRLPEEIYGFNYPLKRTDSVYDHFIPNDGQLTHINCAWPWKDGILVSTLIQGAIGWFDEKDHYRELTRGFVGCHGVRLSLQGQIYFSDSCTGLITFLTPSNTIACRIQTESVWLHDALQLNENLFAAAVADRNRVEIIDRTTRKIVSIIPGEDFGQGPMFVSYGQ